MAVRGQKRFHEEIDVFFENFKKFVIIILTISIFFHEFGHVITNLIFGYKIYGFCVFSLCYYDGNIGFMQDLFGSNLGIRIIIGYDANKYDKFTYSITLISGFIFQFILTFLVIKLLKIKFPHINLLLFITCLAGSIGDFQMLLNLFI